MPDPILLGPAPSATGKGILVAIVDTGVNFEHPHLGLPSRGVAVEWDEDGLTVRPGEHRDRQGHGTCCAALVHWVAPDVELFAVRVTADRPTTDVDRLARGLELSIEAQAQVILAALGTAQDASGRLQRAVDKALLAGAVIVAPDPGAPVFPARCRGAVPVAVQMGLDVARSTLGLVADGRARPMPQPPGDPRPAPPNFTGPSLSAARAAGALARFAEVSALRGASLIEGFSKVLEVR